MDNEQVSSKGNKDLPEAEGNTFHPNLTHHHPYLWPIDPNHPLNPLYNPFHLQDINDNARRVLFEMTYYENCSPQAPKLLSTECFVH
jgi:hypothetical protein